MEKMHDNCRDFGRKDVSDFDSVSFFRSLTEKNRLARVYNFDFAVVSGLDGFDDALHSALESVALVAVDDISTGEISLANTPRKTSFHTVFLFMRHSTTENAAEAREECFRVMRELFRQFCSVIIRQRTRLRLENVIIDENIMFHEIEKYFYTGGACAWFQLRVDKYMSLELNENEWLSNPIPNPQSRLDENTPHNSTRH